MPAGYVTFTKGETTFDVRAYSYGWKDELITYQTEDYTEGGDLLVQGMAPDIEVKVFTFNHLSDAEVANLKSFYQTTINKKQHSFTLTDTDGETEYTMRWMDPIFDRVHDSYNSSTLIMRLRDET